MQKKYMEGQGFTWLANEEVMKGPDTLQKEYSKAIHTVGNTEDISVCVQLLGQEANVALQQVIAVVSR